MTETVKAVLVDDESGSREVLRGLLQRYFPGIVIAGEADHAQQAYELILEVQPQLVFLDIQMPRGDGFSLLRRFEAVPFEVIFVTSYDQYAINAIRFNALDYLLKPVDPDQLSEALTRAADSLDREKMSLKIESFLFNMDNLAKGQKKIVLKTSSNIHIVNLQDVVYCEADRSYTNFYLADKSRIMVSSTLGQYEEMFEGYGFLRIHASYLVNIDFVKRYEKGEGGRVILAGDIELPVAARKKEYLLQLLSRL